MIVDIASITVILAIIAAALKLYTDWRADQRTTATYQRDVVRDNDAIQQRLYDALSKGETEFRQTVYAAYLESRASEKELRDRLDSVTAQLTIITAERDLARRELDRAQEQVHVLQRTVEDQARQIQTLQEQVARLSTRQTEADRYE